MAVCAEEQLLMDELEDFQSRLVNIQHDLDNVDELLNNVTVRGKNKFQESSVKVRTITCFLNFSRDSDERRQQFLDAVKFLEHAKTQYEAYGFEVQTIRIATQSWQEYLPLNFVEFKKAILELNSWVYHSSIFMLSLGPINDPSLSRHVIWGCKMTKFLMFHGNLDDPMMLEPCVDIMQKVMRSTKRGEGNYRFCASASAPAGIPFFPVAYNESPQTSFAIGLENSVLLNEVWKNNATWSNATELLTTALNEKCKMVQGIALGLENEQCWYAGIDTSICPTICDKAHSVGTALEHLIGAEFGSFGTLAAVRCITKAVKQVDVVQTGYCGCMLPVMEDGLLQERAREGTFSVGDLVKYSSVCGIGLDMIPLPGNASKETLVRLLRDIRFLALTLKKPLTARLVLVPEATAGEVVTFRQDQFEFRSSVMPLE